ncbi:hypothetical protein LEP1GSC058_2540 [Leptospira fainei serovar Hurstbridge str. BUT 6]|uniref:Glyoxalase-like domain protein n=1 Tax=Leptospira fainei serovar Hurstbridge str. BUT 6 TaxID=1193011 RepID=S3V9X8_9LEPT|nr:glyoxalase/bleomycin resistance/dioxygenase family protein [Leptospira fainei]EPG73245.1 hypothetical protein LEP1GSC058_2540 [Leptospira fainei serovar Hurstbridge str. BUT 6]
MIHHIAIATDHPDLLKIFYDRLPGIEFEKDNLLSDGSIRSTWFRCGEALIMIEREEFRKGPQALVFDAKSSDIKKQIEMQLGDKIEDRTEYTIYLRDPDGNRIGYSSYPNPWTTQ